MLVLNLSMLSSSNFRSRMHSITMSQVPVPLLINHMSSNTMGISMNRHSGEAEAITTTHPGLHHLKASPIQCTVNTNRCSTKGVRRRLTRRRTTLLYLCLPTRADLKLSTTKHPLTMACNGGVAKLQQSTHETPKMLDSALWNQISFVSSPTLH